MPGTVSTTQRSYNRFEGISFIDIKGKKHNPKNITRNSTFTDVNISNLDEGIYILNIQVDKEVLKVKVVINR